MHLWMGCLVICVWVGAVWGVGEVWMVENEKMGSIEGMGIGERERWVDGNGEEK